MTSPAIGYTLIMRLEMPTSPGAFGALASAIGDAGGIIDAVDMRSVGKTAITRDVSVIVGSDAVANTVRASIKRLEGVRLVSVSDSTFLAHLGGKIRITPTIPVKTRTDLSKVYTPGVARVSLAIAAEPGKAFQLTIKRNTVGVITDGTAVLGLGDIGPLAAAPVMEGKCMLFKQFAGIDAFPICLDTKDTDEIVETVVRIAPIFRRNQPRRYLRAALFRNRKAAAGAARYPRHARRSARHGRRDPRGADQRGARGR